MKDIIIWLSSLEERAFMLYKKAALLFAGDHEMAGFSNRLGDEERRHAEIIKKAADVAGAYAGQPACVALDEGTRQRIEYAFVICEKKIDAGRLSRMEFMDFVAETEYSEWNELFLLHGACHSDPVISPMMS